MFFNLKKKKEKNDRLSGMMEDVMYHKMLLGCLCPLKNQFFETILSPSLLLLFLFPSFLWPKFYWRIFLCPTYPKSNIIWRKSSNKRSFVIIFQCCRRSNHTQPSGKHKPNNNSASYNHTKLQQWRYRWHEWTKSGI